MKKIMSIILTIVLLISSLPLNVFAADSGEFCAVSTYNSDASLLEITRDGAPIRSGPAEKNKVVVRCDKGVVIEKNGSTINKYLNKWYKVTYKDISSGSCYSGYIYSENVQKHSHSFQKFEHDGVTYKFCDCGKINVRVESTATVTKSSALAIAGTAAGSMTFVDGPLPFGDLLGIGVIITAGIMAETGVLPSVTEVQSVFEDIDIDEYYKYKNNNSCPINSYYKVQPVGANLKYLDNQCIDAAVAYVWVAAGGNVWCKDWDTALKVTLLHDKGGFSELDKNGYEKDYWYHFHLGKCTETGKHIDVVGGHIFYGGSARTGRGPI